jgi:hypothetical protein
VSIKSWKEKFYPVPADSATLKSDVDDINHSLQKWIGFRESNLEKHGVSVGEIDVRFLSSALACSLCEKYQDIENTILPNCSRCPIKKLNGFTCNGPWQVWRFGGTPEPMITLLEETLKKSCERSTP